MQNKAIIKILGIFLALFSISMLPPIFIDFIFHDHANLPFVFSFIVTLFLGLFMWFSCRHENKELKIRDGFIVVILFWLTLSFFGSLPFMLTPMLHMTFTDAFFESVSGLTTTGANIIKSVDHLPHAILFYRQELQFLGGMGIIVLALAVLPMLGVGGMQLYRAEVPGPMKEAKLTPRLGETAKTLWYIYVGLAVLCALAYWGAGMDVFDAIGESFSTVSTGGFTMHDASFAYYRSNPINIIAIIFMFLGSVNFSLHFLALRRQSLKGYFKDLETRTYVVILIVLSIIACTFLAIYQYSALTFTNIVQDVFDVVSLASTTGFITSQFSQWPHFLPIMMMVAAIVGGCAASTSGGIKVIRFVLLWKISHKEVKQLLHPHAVFPIKVNDGVLSRHVMEAIWGFIALYILVFFILLFLLMLSGLDFETAYGALAACISNAGASIAQVAYGYSALHDYTKWILIFAMLVGRLEIFTIFAVFLPSFWRY